MRKILSASFLVIFFSTLLHSQKTTSCDFQSPLNIPLTLSGNFGELRASHFHAGIDLRTQGVTGKPVFAACDGYVSRIKIQSGGYGKSLYITHPNGYTTVYAHLERYIPEIENYVLNYQYERESFEIELFPSKEKFKFNKGELIGYSGNSGRSGGPHLHFEIRKTIGQIPVNVLRFNLPIEDKRPPEFKSLYTYTYHTEEPCAMDGSERKYYPVSKKNDSVYTIDKIIECYDNYIGFGAEVYDLLNGSTNRCGVYLLQLIVDDIPRFMFQLDAISFANSRYVNAHMDYELKTEEGRSVHRLFRLPNNLLPIYTASIENGLLYLADDSAHNCEIIAIDAYGNQASLLFTCKAIKNPTPRIAPIDNSTFISWEKGGFFTIDRYSVYIPPKALYQNIYFFAEKRSGTNGYLSDTLIAHRATEALDIGITISERFDSVNENLKDKLVFARVNSSNKLVAEGGEFLDGELSVTTKNFGKYIVVADTTPPVLKPLSFHPGGRYGPAQSMTFQAIDELTGIDTYTAYVDGAWALFEYDAKSGTLRYTIDPLRIEKGRWHEIDIVVDDLKKNQSRYHGRFEY
jgi:hypothetical protein